MVPQPQIYFARVYLKNVATIMSILNIEQGGSGCTLGKRPARTAGRAFAALLAPHRHDQAASLIVLPTTTFMCS
jgi:hypothetical protein